MGPVPRARSRISAPHDGSDLQEGAQKVRCTTVLDDASADDAVNAHRSHFHRFSRRFDALPLTTMGAAHGDSSDNPFTLSNLLFYGEAQIRVCLPDASNVLLSVLAIAVAARAA